MSSTALCLLMRRQHQTDNDATLQRYRVLGSKSPVPARHQAGLGCSSSIV